MQEYPRRKPKAPKNGVGQHARMVGQHGQESTPDCILLR